MFRRSDSQSTFGSLEGLLSPKKRAYLETKHGSGAFRRMALPVLLRNEPVLAPRFCADNGRPNQPVAQGLGVRRFKEMFDFTDEQAIHAYRFDTSWQYALGVEPDDAHVCQKTRHNFRTAMREAEACGELTYRVLFDEVVRAILEDLGLKIGPPRLDSTPICSHRAVLSRLGWFTHTITAFLEKLRKQHEELFAAVPETLTARYVDRVGYFADASSSQGRRRLDQCAADLGRRVDRFRGHAKGSGMASYGRCARTQGRVGHARLVRLAPWKFQTPATILPPNRWTCFSRWVTARRVARWEPDINFARSGYLQRPGLLMTVDAGSRTTVNITTPQGPFRFAPASFRLGTRQRHLDGRIQVDEVPLDTRLSEDETFDDYPAVAVGPGGQVWVAWIQYRRDADDVVIRRYDGSTWHAPEVLSPEPGDFYRVDLAFDGAGRLWVVVGVQVDNDWDLYARVRDGNEWSEPRRLTSAIGSDLNHRLAAGAGRLYLTWKHFGEDGTADIYLSELDVDTAPKPVRVSPSPANDWEPAVTVAPDGIVWVAWDSYDRGNCDIFARAFDRTDNGLTPGESYYYARILQTNNQVAWASPIWITRP